MVSHARALLAAAVAIVVLTSATGCIMPPALPSTAATADPTAEATLEPASSLPELSSVPETVWSAASTGATGSPAIVGDVVVTYEVGDAEQLSLSAFDLASGARRWSLPASTYDIYRGQLHPRLLENEAGAPVLVSISPTYETEGAEFFHTANDVRLIDPSSGAVVRAFDGGYATDLRWCEGAHGYCFWYWTQNAEEGVEMVMTADGDVQEYAAYLGHEGGYPDARIVTESTLVTAADGAGESLVAFVDGGEAWRVPVSDLGFPELHASWISAHEVEEERVLVLQSNGAPAEGDSFTIPAGAFSVAVIDLDSGALIARHDGAVICGDEILCFGDVALDFSYDAQGGEQADFTYDNITLTSFDSLRSGAVEWSASYAHLAHMPGTDPDDALLGWDDFVHVDMGDSQELLDGSSGARYSIGPDDAFGCFSSRSVRSMDADYYGAGPDSYEIDAIAAGCTAAGQTVVDPASFTDAIVRGVGGWTWLDEASTEALGEDDPYGYIEFVPVHTDDALVLFRR